MLSRRDFIKAAGLALALSAKGTYDLFHPVRVTASAEETDSLDKRLKEPNSPFQQVPEFPEWFYKFFEVSPGGQTVTPKGSIQYQTWRTPIVQYRTSGGIETRLEIAAGSNFSNIGTADTIKVFENQQTLTDYINNLGNITNKINIWRVKCYEETVSLRDGQLFRIYRDDISGLRIQAVEKMDMKASGRTVTKTYSLHRIRDEIFRLFNNMRNNPPGGDAGGSSSGAGAGGGFLSPSEYSLIGNEFGLSASANGLLYDPAAGTMLTGLGNIVQLESGSIAAVQDTDKNWFGVETSVKGGVYTQRAIKTDPTHVLTGYTDSGLIYLTGKNIVKARYAIEGGKWVYIDPAQPGAEEMLVQRLKDAGVKPSFAKDLAYAGINPDEVMSDYWIMGFYLNGMQEPSSVGGIKTTMACPLPGVAAGASVEFPDIAAAQEYILRFMLK